LSRSIRSLVIAVVLFVLGALLIGAGWTLRPIGEAQAAVQDGRLLQGLQSYSAAERRLTEIPLATRVAPAWYDAVVTNELALMYALKRYDDVIDKSGATGARGAKFWAGCALFVKADLEDAPEKRMALLSEALSAFRDAIQASPADFDAKYNYEVTSKLIAHVRQDPNAERPKDLNLVTPSSAKPPKKVG